MMECVSSISGILSGLLFVIPFLIIAFWWISLPAYYLLLVIELRSLCRVESSGGKTVGLVGIVIVQAITSSGFVSPLSSYSGVDANERAVGTGYEGVSGGFYGNCSFSVRIRRFLPCPLVRYPPFPQ